LEELSVIASPARAGAGAKDPRKAASGEDFAIVFTSCFRGFFPFFPMIKLGCMQGQVIV